MRQEMERIKNVFKSDVVKVVALLAAMWVIVELLNGCTGGGEYALAMGVMVGAAGGKHIAGEPLTLPQTVQRAVQEQPYEITLMPHTAATDGFYLAKLKKR